MKCQHQDQVIAVNISGTSIMASYTIKVETSGSVNGFTRIVVTGVNSFFSRVC